MPLDVERAQMLRADQQGLSLHAAVRCDAHGRQRLEQLGRTITRPRLANERVQFSSAGQVVRRTEGRLSGTRAAAQAAPHAVPWGAGAQRPAARAGGTRRQGQEAGASGAVATEPGCAHARPVRISWARLLKRVFSCDIT